MTGNWNANPRNLLFAIVVAICTNVSSCTPTPERTQLRLISTVFRHGDRTPDVRVGESYPTDPYQNDTFYPVGVGQLTNNGKRRAYIFGWFLRERYNRFLGRYYLWQKVKARTTEMVRTKMTLQLVLAGMYTPTDLQRWNEYLNWQPIQMSYIPLLQDGLLIPLLCPAFQDSYDALLETEEVKAEIAKYKDMFDELSIETGRSIRAPRDVSLIYHTLYSHMYMGIELPAWSREYFPEGRVKDVAVLDYRLQSYNDAMKRRNGGILLQKIINDMLSVINGTDTESKVYLYSGHEITVAGILMALDVFDNEPPAYTSAALFELHQRGNDFFVKVLHYLGVPSKIRELKIPGCDFLCPIDSFIQLTSHVMPRNEDLKCVAPEPNQTFI